LSVCGKDSRNEITIFTVSQDEGTPQSVNKSASMIFMFVSESRCNSSGRINPRTAVDIIGQGAPPKMNPIVPKKTFRDRCLGRGKRIQAVASMLETAKVKRNRNGDRNPLSYLFAVVFNSLSG
jgi:hypothetical protein